MTVAYLDPYHLGDPLFIPGLARDLAARTAGLVLVHGSGERGERALESLGLTPQAADGVWTLQTEVERAAVERATRELTREVVHELTEQGVPSIGATGADRGLLRLTLDGEVAPGRTTWLGDLVRQGVVAVVSARAWHDDATVEVSAPAAVGALAAALGADAFVLSRRSLERDLAADAVGRVGIDPPVVQAIQASGVRVRMGMRPSLRSDSAVETCFLAL